MKIIIYILIALTIFMFISIGQISDECRSKGGTPVQTNEGTTCIKGVIE